MPGHIHKKGRIGEHVCYFLTDKKKNYSPQILKIHREFLTLQVKFILINLTLVKFTRGVL
jgi:hypothetical protein